MIIQTHFDYKIPKQILFMECMIEDCHSDYFIPLIEKGIKEENNCNYWTNVKGQMTSFDYFNEDETFKKMIIKTISQLNLSFPNLELQEAWGIKINEGEFTQEHNHNNAYSGIFYLNDVDAELDFPELNKSVKCQKGKFLFFTGHLYHKTKPLVKGTKYAIPFNLQDNVKKNI
jgi:hypothetical protein